MGMLTAEKEFTGEGGVQMDSVPEGGQCIKKGDSAVNMRKAT